MREAPATSRFRIESQVRTWMQTDWRAKVVFALAIVALPLLIYALPAYRLHVGFGFLALLALLQVVPGAVDVGADGVMIRWLLHRRFVPMARIASAEAYAEESRRGSPFHWVRLVLTGQQEVHIGMGVADDAGERARRLTERVHAAIDKTRDAEAEGTAALLDRGDRSIAQWIKDLRAIGTGESVTLRTAAITAERLRRIVESSRARPIDRAAAAVALSAAADEDRAHIRVAADDVVERRLRVALETAAEAERGSDESAKLEKALEELAAER